jgi:hypothetical protein
LQDAAAAAQAAATVALEIELQELKVSLYAAQYNNGTVLYIHF